MILSYDSKTRMKIICIAKNYKAHASEMNDPIPSEPIFFLKPDSALLQKNQPFYYPDFSNNVHYELELVVKINRLGKNISERFAKNYYNEIALGIDFTARDLQQNARTSGNPWALSKGFDGSAALSPFIDIATLDKSVDNLDFYLLKNGLKVQQANTNEMLFGVDTLIAYISQYMTLKIGDFIYTGTPSGVGAVQIGDKLEGFLDNKSLLFCEIK